MFSGMGVKRVGAAGGDSCLCSAGKDGKNNSGSETFILEKGRTRGDLIATLQHLRGYRGDGAGLFRVVHGERKRDAGIS